MGGEIGQSSYREPSNWDENQRQIKDNIAHTLDPAHWGADVPLEEKKRNIARNKLIVGTLALLEDVQLTTPNGTTVKDQPKGTAISFDANGAPQIGDLACYIAMGGRVIIECEDEDPSDVLHSLFGVESQKPFDAFVSKKKDIISPKEQQNGKIIAKRTTSTHGFSWKKTAEDKDYLHEIRSFGHGLKKIIPGLYNKHVEEYGVNFAAGGIGNKNPKGNIIDAAGENGHILVQKFSQEQDGKRGALLIGFEPAGYGKTSPYGGTHNILGKSPAVSPFGAQKFRFFKGQGATLPLPELNKDGEPIGTMRIVLKEGWKEKVQNNIEKYTAYSEQAIKQENQLSTKEKDSLPESVKIEAQKVVQGEHNQEHPKPADQNTSSKPPIKRRSSSYLGG